MGDSEEKRIKLSVVAEKMIKTFPNIKIEDVDGNILFYRKYVKDIKPYYYNFRSNSHLKLKYLEDVDY